MSESVDEVTCPKCNKTAIQIQDNDNCRLHIGCNYCGYDSDDETVDDAFGDLDYDDDGDDEHRNWPEKE